MKNDTRPDSIDFGALPSYIGYQVRQAQSAVFRDFTNITRETGVTPGEFSLLALLAANPGIDQITLTRIYRLDKSTLSYSVARLVDRGLVDRTRNPQDRRFYGLWLTAEGEAVLDRVTRQVEEQERAMEAALTPGEREQLLDMLSRIARALNR